MAVEVEPEVFRQRLAARQGDDEVDNLGKRRTGRHMKFRPGLSQGMQRGDNAHVIAPRHHLAFKDDGNGKCGHAIFS
jgi:hypothetical protein